MDKVRVGLIGLYGIANRHCREIVSTPELELGAVCDINEELASVWSEEYEVPWYHDYQDIVTSKDCDFVVICTPHGLHCEMACAAMEAGMPVMIQKVMTITVEEADRVIETAKRTGTKIATFHTAHLAERDVKALIDAGEVGDIMRVLYTSNSARSAAYYRSGEWRGTWAGEGGGVLANQCIHDINRMQYLCGSVAVVAGCTLANLSHPGIQVEDACNATLRFENGAFGVFNVGLYSVPVISGYEIIGNLGSVVNRNGEKKYCKLSRPLKEYLADTTPRIKPPQSTITDAARLEVSTWEPVPDSPPQPNLLLQFAQAIVEDTPPYAPPEFALRDIEVLNAMILSHFKHRPVKLPVPRAEYTQLLQELVEGKHSLHWGPGSGRRET